MLKKLKKAITPRRWRVRVKGPKWTQEDINALYSLLSAHSDQILGVPTPTYTFERRENALRVKVFKRFMADLRATLYGWEGDQE